MWDIGQRGAPWPTQKEDAKGGACILPKMGDHGSELGRYSGAVSAVGAELKTLQSDKSELDRIGARDSM